ncbi:hypothetical protein MC7420_136 [Coleofasciculus chthonoplastes PCC 7420]|uniref:Uncharacterized protein n=1 Tax=Coleofasciculus chthonoplastes PCC 7420 TaxID=118168 RepID=B4W4M4_9CYAN|nr:hypothetical protein MC7420_136 [Coleofasciculus chthonoplastes PCC 7420]
MLYSLSPEPSYVIRSLFCEFHRQEKSKRVGIDVSMSFKRVKSNGKAYYTPE